MAECMDVRLGGPRVGHGVLRVGAPSAEVVQRIHERAGHPVDEIYVTVGSHDRVQGPNPQPGRLIWYFRLVSPIPS